MKAVFAFLAAGLFTMPIGALAGEIMSVNNMDPSCGRYYPGASPKGDDLVKVTFVNTRDTLVWPAWINLGGFVSVVPEDIPAGGKLSTYTRVGHKWMMIDGTNWECFQNLTISPDDRTYTVE